MRTCVRDEGKGSRRTGETGSLVLGQKEARKEVRRGTVYLLAHGSKGRWFPLLVLWIPRFSSLSVLLSVAHDVSFLLFFRSGDFLLLLFRMQYTFLSSLVGVSAVSSSLTSIIPHLRATIPFLLMPASPPSSCVSISSNSRVYDGADRQTDRKELRGRDEGHGPCDAQREMQEHKERMDHGMENQTQD